MATKYGMRLYRSGIELKSDGRRREKLPGRRSVIVKQPKRSTYRGKIAAWSKASARRLAFIAANVELLFARHLTLTYRARKKSWETVTERNLRIIERCRTEWDSPHRIACSLLECGGARRCCNRCPAIRPS